MAAALQLHAPPQGDVGEVMFAVRSDLLRNLGNMTNRRAFFSCVVACFFHLLIFQCDSSTVAAGTTWAT